MTQDEIIEMADKADAEADNVLNMTGEYHPNWHQVRDEIFAKLVAEKEREIWAQRVVRLQNLMDLREQQPNKPCCIAEREACAKVADKYANGLERNYSEIIAEAIRARGQA
jgi:hypothetical protein